MTQKRDAVPLILTAGFILLVLASNFYIFTQPIAEFGDYGANSLLVQQAKHFRLLTGHYSRWHFHHPGPAFLYLFALGEFVFYDLLHLVPAPFNGQLLIAILFNGALLCAALYVFRRHSKLPAPLALLAVYVVIVVSGKPSLLASNWIPEVMMFPFLLFAVSAASVLAGATRDLRFMAFSGMLLIHAHVAQFLFVGIIGGGTVAYILARAQRQGHLREFLSEHRRDFTWAAAIIFVFALPPLLEIALDKPNNLDAVLAYQRQFSDLRNSLATAIDYFACFLLFVGAPQVAIPKGLAAVLGIGFSRPAVIVYWVALAALMVTAMVAGRRAAVGQRSVFLRHLTLVGALSVLLFLYWSTRITGGMLVMNGYFIYSIHLLAWFVLLAAVTPFLDWRVARTLNVAAVTLLVAGGIAERAWMRYTVIGCPDVSQAAAVVPDAPFGKVAVGFDNANWPSAVGLANSMQRLGKPFCVSAEWGFLFARENVCPEMAMADKVWLAREARSCAAPCRYLYRGAAFSLTVSPAQPVTLPVEAGLGDSMDLDRSGFNGAEKTHRWSGKHAAIRFWLSAELPPAPCFRIALTGYALPGRPAQLGVNGRFLGTLSKTELDTAVFVVPREALVPGKVNRISLDTENAGFVGTDRREIGYGFVRMILRAATAEESCVVARR